MDVTDATFETAVLDRSAEVPVVVDLWASWCGPCRTLGPILDKVVSETGGKVELVKVDVDANPRVAATFQVQSIPAVYAISERKVVDSFVGALPEPAVRQWVQRLAPQETEADRLVAKGDEASLRTVLSQEPAHEAALLALSRLLIDRGTDADKEEALSLLARLPETPEVRHLVARARVDDEVSGDVEAKLDALLERVKDDDSARQEFVDLLELLGPDDPRTPAYRRQLTARLF
jgi:putative thioredoxin